MRRVVITGQGIVSSLGNTVDDVAASLREGRSGIRANPVYAERGLRCQVSGRPALELEAAIDRRTLRFMGDAAAYAYLSMQQAIAQSGLTEAQISHPRTGLVAGSGGASSFNQVWAADTLRAKGIKRVGPFMVTRTMGSTVSACLATSFGIKGVNYSISSACATSAHCIGHAAQLIAWGQQDVVFAGGGEEESWELSLLFDAMGAMSSGYNDRPEQASRAFDSARDGFVIAGGGGMLVLEALEHAQARGATILAELVGFGATSDGHDMVAPSGEGAVRCMQQALATVQRPVDYINAHGTSTPVGDAAELGAVREVFGAALAGEATVPALSKVPAISSTKSLSGHSLGAAGAQEAIYALLMLQQGFAAASANIDTPDPAAEGLPLLRERLDAPLTTVMSNSFGFGGTNASLVFTRFDD
ncbi:beta-ketoacyl-ACP synthase I [Rubrivivax albus]|uniref:3-oxoacyl-[acyl-carrier-protein] synthase 1 n=1 Tax=Rubrivivax albus TaxID=2499835 RepID=A0A437JUT1_9BURK|nr:beta-ketoacyl-ACP synthase I [Rubrivivax albus]RVT50991.1 beta-ketoacyl-ACP synthase I [Rubrivivax albus]